MAIWNPTRRQLLNGVPLRRVGGYLLFTWPAFFMGLALYWISLSFGIGMGYHRLLTHRSY
ncbi:MAG TPA: hypothetical protein VKR43_13980 [Bryobacteraceae bacterium]|nr:hypothetical protein [Bryobacteraceae bacterium]